MIIIYNLFPLQKVCCQVVKNVKNTCFDYSPWDLGDLLLNLKIGLGFCCILGVEFVPSSIEDSFCSICNGFPHPICY